MIELPRACVTSDEIATQPILFFRDERSDQTTYGLSRDDAGKFLPFYIEGKILLRSLLTIDREGLVLS